MEGIDAFVEHLQSRVHTLAGNDNMTEYHKEDEHGLDGVKGIIASLDGLLREGEERLMLLSLLGRQCRQLRYAKAMAQKGAQAGEIAGKIGVPPFAVKKTLDLARHYSMEQLAAMAKMCLETEYQVKSGQLMDAGSLEQVMLKILALRGK